MDLDFKDKFKDSYTKILSLGEAYAEAKGQSWQMQELKSSVLSRLILQAQEKESSVSKCEIIAKASDDFKTYVIGTSEAIKTELSLKARYEAEKARFEAYRSLSSLEKATRNIS